MIERFKNKYSDGGFNYLLNHGAVFTNAHYQHAKTETIVGHTTLATCTYPSEHGMIGNVWFDSDNQELSYNIEDADHTIIPEQKKIIQKTRS